MSTHPQGQLGEELATWSSRSPIAAAANTSKGCVHGCRTQPARSDPIASQMSRPVAIRLGMRRSATA